MPLNGTNPAGELVCFLWDGFGWSLFQPPVAVDFLLWYYDAPQVGSVATSTCEAFPAESCREGSWQRNVIDRKRGFCKSSSQLCKLRPHISQYNFTSQLVLLLMLGHFRILMYIPLQLVLTIASDVIPLTPWLLPSSTAKYFADFSLEARLTAPGTSSFPIFLCGMAGLGILDNNLGLLRHKRHPSS
jgi:hypothetical protein